MREVLKIFKKNCMYVKPDLMQAFILGLFFFPLFFQLSGEIFTSTDFGYDSQGLLLQLPLPIASVFCFIGIAFLLRLEKAHLCTSVIFTIFMMMMLSTIISSVDVGKTELAKFIFLVQFILPMFALILGNLYLKPESNYLRVEAVVIYMLLIIIPLEVTATVLHQNDTLSPDLYIFSLYQQTQYLPVIFIGLYFFAAASLYEKSRLGYLVLFLAPWMGIYLAISQSRLAIVLAVVGIIIFILGAYKNNKIERSLTLVLLLIVSLTIYYPVITLTKTDSLQVEQALQTTKEAMALNDGGGQEGSYKNKITAGLTEGLKERFFYWEYYGKRIIESPKILFFGHQSRPERNKFHAHNYYLDLIYNFGVVSALPFFYLIFVTIRNFWRITEADLLTKDLVMLSFIVGFFVLTDSLFKVSFRQPYPGMMVFFLWGLLLARLSEVDGNMRFSKERKNKNE
jgi:O-antigen ligase/polysaccharide polymerase Wzy-like membrane protein